MTANLEVAGAASGPPAEIACDESGSEGENLVESRHRVFAHGSVYLTPLEADGVVNDIRVRLGIRGSEVKAKRFLRTGDRCELAGLFDSGGPLNERAHVVLVDKLYFAVGKVIDLLVEEEAYTRGIHLHADGSARAMASTLFTYGPRALGARDWTRLLGAFVSLIRRRQRSGVKATLDEFYSVIDDVRLRGHRSDVSEVLALVWESRHQARQYGDSTLATARQHNLEPLLATLLPTAGFWAARHRSSVLLVHDRQSALTSDVVQTVVSVANRPHPEFPYRVPLTGIVQTDSVSDSRVQLADLAAGFGRLCGELALESALPSALRTAVEPLINRGSIWDDRPSWQALTGGDIGT